jgi:diacylglycerol O-acyltransferase / wax synthase
VLITNVPGPQFPLYLLGRKLRACYPQVPLAAQQTLGVALLSHHGNVGVGLLADLDVRDLPAFTAAMRGSLAELLACATAGPESTVGTSPSGSADTQSATPLPSAAPPI